MGLWGICGGAVVGDPPLKLAGKGLLGLPDRLSGGIVTGIPEYLDRHRLDPPHPLSAA